MTAISRTTVHERFPIPCALYSDENGLHDEGTILNLSLTQAHVESPAALAPGMILALFVILPGTSCAVVIEAALVTWVRGGECGLRLDGISPEDAVRLEIYLHKTAATRSMSPAPRLTLVDEPR